MSFMVAFLYNEFVKNESSAKDRIIPRSLKIHAWINS